MTQQNLNNDLEDTSEDDFLDSIGEEDFVFVLDRDGQLKTMLLPEEYENTEMPENLSKVLKVFGISGLEHRVLH